MHTLFIFPNKILHSIQMQIGLVSHWPAVSREGAYNVKSSKSTQTIHFPPLCLTIKFILCLCGNFLLWWAKLQLSNKRIYNLMQIYFFHFTVPLLHIPTNSINSSSLIWTNHPFITLTQPIGIFVVMATCIPTTCNEISP